MGVLLSESDEPLAWRAGLFVLTLGVTTAVTVLTVVKSKVLAGFLDALSDERVSWPNQLRVLRSGRRR